MHVSYAISYVLWKDKCQVLPLSMHATLVVSLQGLLPIVPRCHRAVLDAITMSPVLVEYTTHMRGVDIADHLKASYSSQIQGHKWWHRVYWFLVDTSVVNMYVMHVHRCGYMEDQ